MNKKLKELIEDIKYGIETGKDKETNIEIDGYCLSWKNCKIILDYITNLQQENNNLKTSLDESQEVVIDLQQENISLAEENEKLKQKLNCKEKLTKIMPEDTEFIILSKNDYDRQEKDIELIAIELRERIEKAVEYIERNCITSDSWEDLDFCNFVSTEKITYKELSKSKIKELLNILNGRSDE